METISIRDVETMKKKKEKSRRKISTAKRRIINIIIFLSLQLLVLVVANGLYQNLVIEDAKYGLFGIGDAVVVSGSMVPEINVNDLILYRNEDPSQYAIGDVVIFERLESDGTTAHIVHRIVAMDDVYVTTKGDANQMEDVPILRSQIIGRVFLIIPKFGVIRDFYLSVHGWIITIGILLLITALYIVSEVALTRRELKKISSDKKTQQAIRAFFIT